MKLVKFRALCMRVTCAVLFTMKFTVTGLGDKELSSVVQTKSGAVVGKIETLPHGKSVHEYLGIPYAEPPVGELRFAAPKPAKHWSGTKDVTKFGPSCIQASLPHIGVPGPKSEDCLFLNVFVPSSIKPTDKMAVMVWFHGGGFVLGSSTGYPGGVLASFNDVIVVSVNFRLAILGFFNVPGTDTKGNYGMLDQVLALKWVKDNIASFGGDPNRVTIFGESGGAIAVSLHLVSPLSKGLFHRAIMQSGAASSPLYGGRVTKPVQLQLFAKFVNCSMGPNLVECVRGKSVEDILKGQMGFWLVNYTGTHDIVAPVVDGEFLPDLPEILFKTGKYNTDVDVITGFTSNEGALALFLRPPGQLNDGLERAIFETIVSEMLYARERNQFIADLILFQYTDHEEPHNKNKTRQSMINVFGDSCFAAPALLEAKALAKGGRSPYVYVFNHRVVYSYLPEWTGVIHGMEVPFVFGAPFKNIPEPFTNILATKYSEIEKGFSLYVMKLWTDFAKHGSPNPSPPSTTHPVPETVKWPEFTEKEQAYLVLDLKPRVERRYKVEKMAFWNDVVPKVAEFSRKKENESDE